MEIPSIPHRRSTWWRLAVVVSVLALTTGVGVAWTRSSAPASNVRYYVSIGDSYASGYRPDGPGFGAGSSEDSFVYQVGEKLAVQQSGWQIVNFACTGETAYAMSFDKGCQAGAGAVDGPDYQGLPQAVAAADFVAAHRDQVGLVTVAAGGNDIQQCLDLPDPAAFQGCAEQQVPKVKLSLDALLSRVRDAVGPTVPIVGVSYINVYDADTLKGDQAAFERVERADTLFRNYLNPALSETYSKYGAKFVDSTGLAGGYLPDSVKSWLPDHGTVPAAIGRVCTLTYYCSNDDPHPNRAGHSLIATEVEKLVSP